MFPFHRYRLPNSAIFVSYIIGQIIFYLMLMNIFTMFVFKCKETGVRVTVKKNGTMVVVVQDCDRCGDGAFKWQSQPLIFGRYPAGNIMLSSSILMAGASVSKVLLVCRHMGLCVYSARTYFFHQKKFLFSVILNYWETYRHKLVNMLKKTKDVVWCGDGRFDSMGHSAKFGVYTMFCCTIMKIVHFEVVQANEVGGSQQTELEGAKRHILASLHFNENIQRNTYTNSKGEECLKISWPKFKLGEEVVRRLAVPPSFGYVEEIKELLLTMSETKMKQIYEKYSSKAPDPMNTQFPDKLSKAEAVKQYHARKQLVTELFPVAEEQARLDTETSQSLSRLQQRNKTPRHCRKCNRPMKGHKQSDCRKE